MNFTEYVRQLPQGSMGRPQSLWTRVHLDPYLFAALLAVALGGMVVLYSATSGDMGAVYRQAIRFGLGFLAMVVIAQFDPRWFQQWGGTVYLLGVLLLVAVIINGTQAMGAQRWLQIPGVIRFQPSEVMKLAMPVMLAWYISRFGLPPRYRDLLASAVLLFVPVALIVQQPDLGTSLLIASSGLFVIFLAGLSWKLIVSFSAMAIGMIPVLWIWVMRDYQRQRVLTLFDPNIDPLGSGWNIIQSMTAIGSGGISGKGYMQGTQSQLDFLPESHTDFIIAVLGEEFGFVGTMVLIALYAIIILRGMLIAIRARDNFCRLLAGSLTLTFFIYVFVNIGMVSGILPVVGVPLPLVSYGGTSIVTLLTGFGMLMSISTHQRN